MGRIGWVAMLVELATIETIDKQSQRTFKCMGTARETTRRSGQTSQVVSQLSIVAFHRECVGFASSVLSLGLLASWISSHCSILTQIFIHSQLTTHLQYPKCSDIIML